MCGRMTQRLRRRRHRRRRLAPFPPPPRRRARTRWGGRHSQEDFLAVPPDGTSHSSPPLETSASAAALSLSASAYAQLGSPVAKVLVGGRGPLPQRNDRSFFPRRTTASKLFAGVTRRLCSPFCLSSTTDCPLNCGLWGLGESWAEGNSEGASPHSGYIFREGARRSAELLHHQLLCRSSARGDQE